MQSTTIKGLEKIWYGLKCARDAHFLVRQKKCYYCSVSICFRVIMETSLLGENCVKIWAASHLSGTWTTSIQNYLFLEKLLRQER